MPHDIRMPTYEEIIGLSNGDLMNQMKQLIDQINETRARGKNTDELARIYKVYEEEWFKRLAVAWHKHQ